MNFCFRKKDSKTWYILSRTVDTIKVFSKSTGFHVLTLGIYLFKFFDFKDLEHHSSLFLIEVPE